jgi:hypothetical protein
MNVTTESKLNEYRKQLHIVELQGNTVNNGGARKYLEKKISELEYQLSLLNPPASAPSDSGHAVFDRLFPTQ